FVNAQGVLRRVGVEPALDHKRSGNGSARPMSCCSHRLERRSRPLVERGRAAIELAFRRLGRPSAPAGTPRPIIERLNKELRSMIESEEMRKHIVAEGADPIARTPEEYAANIVREEGKWATLIKKLGLKIE